MRAPDVVLKCVIGVLVVLAWAGETNAQWQQWCNGDWIRTPDGLGHQCVPAQPPAQSRCPSGASYCANVNLCCNPGFYCSKYGCAPHGAVECGGWYCNPGYKCARVASRGCLPNDASECGDGKRCGAGYKCSRGGGCVPQDAVDCGQGRYCPKEKACWTARTTVPGLVERGQIKCVTEDPDELHEKIAEFLRNRERVSKRREEWKKAEAALRAAEAESKREQEHRKRAESEEERKRAEERQKETLKKQLEQKLKEAELKHKDDARREALMRQLQERLKEAKAQSAESSRPGPTRAGQHTFMCGTPPNQYLCPSAVDAQTMPRPDANTTQPGRDPFIARPTEAELKQARKAVEEKSKKETEELIQRAQQEQFGKVEPKLKSNRYIEYCGIVCGGCAFGQGEIGRSQRWCTDTWLPNFGPWKMCDREWVCGPQ